MKALKKTILVLFGLILVLTIISLFLSENVHVERSVVINAPSELIFEQVNTITNWNKWSPWHLLDSTMEKKYEGPASGKGAKYTWKSTNKNVGSGSMIITSSDPYSSLKISLDLGNNSKSSSCFYLLLSSNRVKVIWTLDSKLGNNPIAKYIGLFFDKIIGKDFEKGLNNLKVLCEKYKTN